MFMNSRNAQIAMVCSLYHFSLSSVYATHVVSDACPHPMKIQHLHSFLYLY